MQQEKEVTKNMILWRWEKLCGRSKKEDLILDDEEKLFGRSKKEDLIL